MTTRVATHETHSQHVMSATRGRGTIFPTPNFNAEKVASRLRRAMRGIGTEEKVIIEILTRHNNAQRQMIKRKYKNIYGRVLSDDVKAELGGHFEVVCLALLTPLSEYIVDCLYFAFNGAKPDELCIIEILASLDVLEIRYVEAAFQEKYKQELGAFLRTHLDGDIKRVVLKLISKNRQISSDIDQNSVLEDAQTLHKVGLKNNWDRLLIHILTTCSKAHSRAAIATYERIAGQSFRRNLKVQFEGSLKRAIISIVECIENRPAFFAKQLRKSLNGTKTDDKTLIRILVSRSEVDLSDIQEWYHIRYNSELSEAIYADTSGDYRKILMKLLDP